MTSKLVACLLGLCCLSAVANDFKTADQLYEEQRFDEALVAYRNLATIGDAYSQYQIGVMHLHGESVSTDYVQAIAWMQLAHHNAPELGIGQQIENVTAQLQQQGVVLDDVDSVTQSLLSQYGQRAVTDKFSPVFLADTNCEYQPSEWVKRASPKYPKSAIRQGRSGSVRLQYNISSEGYARDIQVLGTTHDAFIKPTVKVLTRWQQEPSAAPGLKLEDVQTKLDYRIGGTEADEDRVKKVIDQAVQKAESGDIVAQYELAKTISFWRTQLKGMGLELSNFKDANKWNHKAAEGGHPLARYELGKSMIHGKGCEVNIEAGLAWIRASAIAGYAPAKGELGKQLLNKPNANKAEAIQLLSEASQGGHYLSSMNLAWLLATSDDPKLRDGERALHELDRATNNYFDDVRILETKAAAYAAINDFDEAIDYQEDAIDQADDYDWEIPIMQQRLASYRAKQLWSGDYYQ